MAIAQLAALVGILGLATCIVCLVALHILPTGFHPLHDPVSNYVACRYGYLYRIQAFSSGVGAAGLLAALALAGIALPMLGLVTLGCYALARMVIPLFPTDVDTPRTRTGTIHLILAIVAFAGIAVATGSLTFALVSLPAWAGLEPVLRTATQLTEVSAIIFSVSYGVPALKRFGGLFERGIYVGALVWLVLVTVPLVAAAVQTGG